MDHGLTRRSGAEALKIEELGLIEPALSGAITLQLKHPEILFTSGRRTRFTQAHAMAVNVVQDRQWIKATYRETPETLACQKYVDDHPEATSVNTLYNGLLGVLNNFTDPQLAEWNHHLAGLAFDVQPEEKDAELVKADIRALAGLDLFLEKEGNLRRWHAQFNPLPIT